MNTMTAKSPEFQTAELNMSAGPLVGRFVAPDDDDVMCFRVLLRLKLR